ncbi:MAG: alcohol dehydrogenase catalytic domain-containing protein, partial [Alphaproteobacteria bacterium]
MFKGLVIEKHEQGEGEKPKFTASVQNMDENQLPDGDVTIDVSYSSFNYKDGLVTLGLGGLTKEFPHVPGIDLAGKVSASESSNFVVGDEVILTGWRCGE